MRAVLVFCEGRHDVIFAQRSLGAHADCQWLKKTVSELPTPFGSGHSVGLGLILGPIRRRPLEGLHLQNLPHTLPSFEAVLEHPDERTIFVMVRMHGSERGRAITGLLRQLDMLIDKNPSKNLDISDYAAAFLYDADRQGIDGRIATFRQQFSEYLGDLEGLGHATWSRSTARPTPRPVGLFVFHQPGASTGTLEAHLGPMARRAWPERVQAASAFIDEHADGSDPVRQADAERWKAVITAAGQFVMPGDPMSIVIGHRGLPREVFEQSPVARELSAFLTSVPWLA